MTLAAPWWALAGILGALAFIALAAAGDRARRADALTYSNLAFFERAAGRGMPWRALFTGIWALTILAVGIAFARPSFIAMIPVRDASVVICIDTSGSMRSTDIVPSREIAARNATQSFVDALPEGTRVAVVAFSSAALPLSALTDDRNALHDAVDRIPPANGGTAIGDALATAARLLPPQGKRAIVLVTDGVNNTGQDPVQAAATIGAAGIAIDTVGIGTNNSGSLIPGTAEEAQIDEDALRTIAQSGHGTYALVGDASSLRDRLAHLALQTVREKRRIDAAFPLAAGAALVALVTVAGGLLAGRFP